MKVFVLYQISVPDYYEEYTVLGVFSSRAKAMEYIEKEGNIFKHDMTIDYDSFETEEFEIDKY